MPTVAHRKDTTIQIRLPADAKKKISKRAEQVGLSVSEYARTMLLFSSGALNEEAERFWKETEKIEAEYHSGKYEPSSVEELIAIAREA